MHSSDCSPGHTLPGAPDTHLHFTLQYFWQGQWGKICFSERRWRWNEAKATCNALGYRFAEARAMRLTDEARATYGWVLKSPMCNASSVSTELASCITPDLLGGRECTDVYYASAAALCFNGACGAALSGGRP